MTKTIDTDASVLQVRMCDMPQNNPY